MPEERPTPRRPCAACTYDLHGLRGRVRCPSCGAPLPDDLVDLEPPLRQGCAMGVVERLTLIIILGVVAALVVQTIAAGAGSGH